MDGIPRIRLALMFGCSYNGAYFDADTLEPGKGYWIRASDSGNITLFKGYVPTGGTQFVNRMNGANWIDFTNAIGNKTTLYFGITVPENEQLSYSMPPLPPDSLLDSTALDARFTGDWKYTDSTAQIEITNHSYPLTIEYGIVNGDTGDWNLSNFGLPKPGSGIEDALPFINHTLKSKGRIVISEPVKSILLNKVSNNNIPKKFALHQNYPNPFNSSTTIKYDLPEKIKVKIVIYDILGRRVKVLIDKTEEPGYKSIIWDATNDYGVPIASGLYFYRIETKNFQKTKKLLLIK